MGGSQSTRIANGYSEDIRAMVKVNRELHTKVLQEERNKLEVSMPSGLLGVAGVEKQKAVGYECKHLLQLPGFIRVRSGEYLAFNMAGKDGQVFVSIVADKVIAENFPVYNGRNIIVDANGYLKNAKRGSIWRDEQGKNHSISQKPQTTQLAIRCKAEKENEEEQDLKTSIKNATTQFSRLLAISAADEEEDEKCEDKEQKAQKQEENWSAFFEEEEEHDESQHQEEEEKRNTEAEEREERREIEEREDEKDDIDEENKEENESNEEYEKEDEDESNGIFISSLRDFFAKRILK